MAVSTECTIDLSYNSTLNTITNVNPGNNTGTSKTQIKSSTVFQTLANATVTVGGNDVTNTYVMTSMTVL